MNDVIIKDNIEDLIYEIRGKQVMLDSDLTRLYECVNKKTINLAVKRHINRITEKFMFQLTQEEFNIIPKFQVETLVKKEEHNNLRFQSETSKPSNMSRTLPYAFKKQEIKILEAVFRTKVATEIIINIISYCKKIFNIHKITM